MKRVVVLAIVALLISAEPVNAAPLVGFLGAVVGKLTGSVIGRLLVSVALSALSAALAPRPKTPGLRTTTTLQGGVTPEATILGRSATGGTFVCPPMSHGMAGKTPNAYLTYVIELSGIPGTTLEGLILNGERVEILTNAPHPDYGRRIGGKYLNRAWIKYYDGTQTAADPMLLAKYGPPYVRPWTSAMVGHGIAYAILTFRYDREVFQSWPEARFELGGIPLYDPRRDSTVGGLGSQLWNDPSTWTPTDNAAVIVYNILRGITWPNGQVWGGGVPAALLPHDLWAAEMDLADELVPDGAGGTERQFRAGLEIRADDEPFSVIEEILRGTGGALSENGGTWTLRLGPPRLPVLFLTDDDIIADEEETYQPFPPPDRVYNAVTATYPDPAKLWESVESPLQGDPDWEARDGERRVASLSLPATPYPGQVQRVTRALLLDNRRFARHQLTLPPTAAALEALDVISWTSAANGYVARLFEVVEAVRDPRTQLVRVSLRSVDPGDWVPVAPEPPGVIVVEPQRNEPQGVPGFVVEPLVVTVAGENRRAGIRVLWAPDGAEDAVGLRIAYRLAGDATDGTEAPLAPPRAGSAVLIDGIVPGQAYQVRARWQVDRPTVWTDWASVTAPDVRLGLPDLRDDLANWIDTMGDWIAGGVTDLPGELAALGQSLADEAAARSAALAAEAATRAAAVQNLANDLAAEAATRASETIQAANRWRENAERIRQLTAETLEIGARDHLAREQLRQSLAVQLNDLSASFTQQVDLLVTAQGATAQQVTQLTAESAALAARVTEVDQARIDGDNALAATISALAVGTATQFDAAVTWYFDESGLEWTGSPNNPTAVDGYLRPAGGSWVASPAGLNVAGVVYRQVRARLRRVGNPTWVGRLYWAADGQGWDTARSQTADEPTWSGGYGLITWDLTWTGTIDRIRLDLANDTDASNYVEIDWLSIGRPAPGASSAELLAERQARIAADSAQVTRLDLAEARLTTAEGSISANANAIDALDVRVTDTEAGLVSLGTRTTALENTVNDPVRGVEATADAVDVLATQVEALDDGSQVLQAEAIRALQTALRRVAAESADGLANSAITNQAVRDYVASASQSLTTRIDATDTSVAVLAQAVTLLQAAIPGLATVDALNALTAVVTQQGDTLTAQGAAITNLQAQVNDPATGLATRASASALNALETRVTAAENVNTSQSAAITNLQATINDPETGLATRASANALSALETRVTAAENVNTSQSAAITNLQATINDPQTGLATRASASALNALETRVTAAENVNTSQSTAITNLQAQVNDPATGLATRASASALNALETRVTATENVNTSQSNAITNLQATIDDPATGLASRASASALNALDVRVTQTESGLTLLGSRTTALENTVNDPATGVTATATALSNLSTRVTSAEGAISSLSTSTTALSAGLQAINLLPNGTFTGGSTAGWTLPSTFSVVARNTQGSNVPLQTALTPHVLQIAANTATQTATAASGVPVAPGDVLRGAFYVAVNSGGNATLRLRVRFDNASGNEISIVTLLEATHTNNVWTRYTGDAVVVPTNAVSATVFFERLGGGSAGAYVTNLRVERRSVTQAATDAELAATATAVSFLETRVTAAENVNTAQSAAITSLQATINDPVTGLATRASANAVNTLSTQVTQLNGDVTALSDSLTSVSARVDDIGAEGRFRVTAVGGPSGFARVGLQARTTQSGTWREAGLYIDTPTNPSLPSRVGVAADQFVVLTSGSPIAPFVIDGDDVFVNAASIRLTGQTVVDGSFAIRSATTGERIEQTPTGIRVYDAAGVLRVKIGDLS